MRLRLLLSLMIVLPLALFSQKKKYMAFDENWQIARTPALTTYTCECYVDEESKFIGTFTCYHQESNSIVKEYNFNRDVLHGTVKEFYLDGKIKLDAQYYEGSPINSWKEYGENGDVVLERTFPARSILDNGYLSNLSPYDQAVAFSHKKEEPPIYTTDCIRLKIEDQRYMCSQAAVNAYLNNVPIPEILLKDPNFQGRSFECFLLYTINEKGIVSSVEIVSSTGDDFLDLLAEAHVLNMVPFESAKQYGIPVSSIQEAHLVFNF